MTDMQNTNVDDWLNKASDLPEDRVDYANNVRIHVSTSEVIIDFYFGSPNPKQPRGEPQVKHIQRMVLPITIAKDMGEILVNSVLRWEEDFGVTLPLHPMRNADKDEDAVGGS
jgi:hypothetical protein